MSVRELIEVLLALSGDAEISAWDADNECYQPVSGVVFDYGNVVIQTDRDDDFVTIDDSGEKP